MRSELNSLQTEIAAQQSQEKALRNRVAEIDEEKVDLALSS